MGFLLMIRTADPASFSAQIERAEQRFWTLRAPAFFDPRGGASGLGSEQHPPVVAARKCAAEPSGALMASHSVGDLRGSKASV
jgi:hypothetical protein